MTSTYGEPEIRLPTTLKPVHYDLIVVTKLSDPPRFGGLVTIDLEVQEETSDVVLNAATDPEGLDVLPAQITVLGKTINQETTVVNKELAQLTIKFPVVLQKGSTVRLRVPFTSRITDLAVGYYSSPFTVDGVKKICTLTQFEPVYGRSVFPCWDEPALKATFSVTMVSQPETVNVSNMPMISERAYAPGDNVTVGAGEDLAKLLHVLEFDNFPFKVTTFDKTPKMSLYLLAWGNGEFKSHETFYTSKISGKKRSLKIYGTPDAIGKLEFAMNIGAQALPLYEAKFDIEYALPKLDTLVVDNYDSSAMENWGLITGRGAVYEFDPTKGDLKARKDVIETQSHECAHMWFGNYTSPAWWSSLWLNEGFASLMGEVVIMDELPDAKEFDVYTSFIDVHLSRALSIDAQRASHAVQVPIPDAKLIDQIFDGLTYSKAASVLRMLMFTVGKDTFFKGVSTYLKAHAYGNAEPKDLWDGIQSVLEKDSKLDVAALMDNWVLKIGFPVLTVTETANGIDVIQNRFLDTADVKSEEDTTIWNIPLFLTRSSEESAIDTAYIMRERQVHIPLDTSGAWKLNGSTWGPYRVSYTSERWEKIAEEMIRPNGAFATSDRMGLISDVFALAQAGKNKTSLALDILARMTDESEYLVWVSAIASLTKLLQVWWAEDPEYDQLNAFRGSLVSKVVDRVGLDNKEGDKFNIIQLRALVIEQAAYGGNSKVLAHLKKLYDDFVATGATIPADILEITLIMAVVNGGQTEYDNLKKLYLTKGSTGTTTLKHGAIAALSSTNDKDLLNETFRIMQENADKEDVVWFFRALGPRRASRRKLADFMLDEKNYKKMHDSYAGSATWPNLIKAAFINLTSKADVAAIEDFLKDKQEDRKLFELALNQTLDTIRASAGWLSRHSKDVSDWLKTRNDASYEA